MENKLLERLADLEHEQWATLIFYLMSKHYLKADKFQMKEWKDLIDTKYKDLSEFQKEKDRVWARKVLDVISVVEDRGKF